MSTTWNSSPGDGRAAPGSLIGGRYALRTAIGTGGMGTVWRASDTLLRRDVAVKEVVCPPGMARSDRESMYERTMREARAAAGLAHPSVVQVYDVVTEAGRPWIVMEMLDARSLADMVIEGGPMAPRMVAKIGIALLGALEVAHAAGVLHRDVKPANVLICADGRCVLTDFGVARMPSDVQLTTPGMVLGSPHFISPERAMGHAFGPPSDLFSLGVTLFTAVEGRPPFDKGDPLATMHAVVEEPPAAFALAGPLSEVLSGLLIKEPAQRWDVHQARSALRELLAGPLAQATTPAAYTDPWSVMPPPAGQWTDPTAVAPSALPAPTKQVGGKALLPTGAMPELAGPYPAPAPAKSGVVRTVRTMPRGPKIGIAALAAAILLAGTVTAASLLLGGNTSGAPDAAGPSAPGSSAPASAPASPPAGTYKGAGFTVVLPPKWEPKKQSGGYFQANDPGVSGRWIRMITSNGADASKILTTASNNLSKRGCEDGYQKIGISDTQLSGQPASVLEYNCTPKGGKQRHGLWYAVASGGKVYQFYLSTWEADFGAAKELFDASVATYKLAV
jgi:eukaryotic-like serine/threonine-protein kinase